MKHGKVCEKHQEFSPDGECRWCEPPPSEAPKLSFADAARARIEAMEMVAKGMLYGISSTHSQWGPPPLQQQQAQQGLGASPLNAMPPLPVASCKHDGVLYDYGGTTSCAACGKILTSPAKAGHYPSCPLRGHPLDDNQAADLARGCICVPFP